MIVVGTATATTSAASAAAATKAIVRNGTIVVVYASVGVIVSIGYCGGRGSRTDSIRICLNEHTVACYFNCCHHFLFIFYFYSHEIGFVVYVRVRTRARLASIVFLPVPAHSMRRNVQQSCIFIIIISLGWRLRSDNIL